MAETRFLANASGRGAEGGQRRRGSEATLRKNSIPRGIVPGGQDWMTFHGAGGRLRRMWNWTPSSAGLQLLTETVNVDTLPPRQVDQTRPVFYTIPIEVVRRFRRGASPPLLPRRRPPVEAMQKAWCGSAIIRPAWPRLGRLLAQQALYTIPKTVLPSSSNFSLIRSVALRHSHHPIEPGPRSRPAQMRKPSLRIGGSLLRRSYTSINFAGFFFSHIRQAFCPGGDPAQADRSGRAASPQAVRQQAPSPAGFHSSTGWPF